MRSALRATERVDEFVPAMLQVGTVVREVEQLDQAAGAPPRSRDETRRLITQTLERLAREAHDRGP